MISYLTKKGCLVFHYNRDLDNFRQSERAALIKHNLVNARVTTIGVTAKTDFLKCKNDNYCHSVSAKA